MHCNTVSFQFFYGVVCSEIVLNCSPPTSLVQWSMLVRWFIPWFLFLFDSTLQSWGPAVAVGPLCGCSLVCCSSTLQAVGPVVAVCKFLGLRSCHPSSTAMFSCHHFVAIPFFSTWCFAACKKDFSMVGVPASKFCCRTSFFVVLFFVPGNHAFSYANFHVLDIVP